MTEPSRKIEPIQSLRGVAIVAVFLMHTLIWYAVADALGGGRAYSSGHLGVDLFFVISGFVVTLSLHRGDFSVPSFYVKRVFRLLPAMLVMLALGIAVALVIKEHPDDLPFKTRSRSEAFRQAGYVLITAFAVRVHRGRPQEYCFSHTWSLNVEEQFYLAVGVFCFILGLIIRSGNRDRKLAVCGIVAFALCTALHALRIFQPAWAPAPEVVDPDPLSRLAAYALVCRFDAMLSGVALFAASHRLSFRVPGNRWASAALHAATFVPFFYFGWTGLMGNPPSAGWPARTAYLAVNISFAIAVFLAARNVPLFPSGSIIDRTLNYLGERSYAIYLLQYPFTLVSWMLLYELLPHAQREPMTHAVFTVAIVALLTLPTVHAVHRFVELPGIARGSRLAKRWFGAPAA